MFILALYRDGQWQPGIGDPTAMGWLIVAAYLCGSFFGALCWRWRHRLIRREQRRRYGLFWLAIGLVMLALAVNKQLDLQSLMHHLGRNLAIDQGWFDDRRVVQKWFLVGVGAAGVLSVAVMLLLMRGLWHKTGLATVGIAVLCAFIVMRAASFHSMDQLLKTRVAGVYINHAMELAGIALVTAGAVLNLVYPKSTGPLASRKRS